MALKSNSPWQMLHFLVRLAGITAFMAALIGWFMAALLDQRSLGSTIAGVGVVVVILALIVEARAALDIVSSRRGAFGFNVVFQVALMIVLVVGCNVFSFWHFKRFDCTRDRLFTLPSHIREQLLKLHADTDIVVVQNHVSFGQSAENKQDKYDFAAERKIVEKVRDLADQFSDLGPRFRVHLLDIQDDNYEKKLKEIETLSKDLADAVEKAPENSVFFYTKERNLLQRLSFSDVYQLDKQASIDDKNLVLNYQGVGPFAEKIFNIEEKKPRIGLAVVHPLLGFHNKLMPKYTMAGAKKTLSTYGFDMTDIVLRKIGEEGELTEDPTALTYDESRFEQIEDELAELEESIAKLQKDLVEVEELNKFWTESSLAKLNTKYVYYLLEDGRQGVMLRSQIDGLKKSGVPHKLIDVDEDDRTNRMTVYKHNLDVMRHVLQSDREERENLLKEKSTLKAENLAEKRRQTDIEAKTKAMLADLDLLIIPRMTLINAPDKELIPNRIHRLDPAQLNAVKAFLKEGKPVLFLLGPTNDFRDLPELGGADSLEQMVAEFGFKLPNQTILYNIEGKEFNERKLGGIFARKSSELEIPGVKFDDVTLTSPFSKVTEKLDPHAIRTSLKMMNRTTGAKKSQEVRIRHPRPVYVVKTFVPAEAAAGMVGTLALGNLPASLQASTVWLNRTKQKSDENAVFLVTREESWNEEKPFITKDAQGIRIPRYTPTKDDDPVKNTVEEPRRGPFPIGAAIESKVPSSWFDKDPGKAPKVRVAVIGSGSVFAGASLQPMQEKMLLDVTNWLMGRDNLLARDVESWSYPRVTITKEEATIWGWAARIGLPLLFLYLGAIVGLVRRMR